MIRLRLTVCLALLGGFVAPDGLGRAVAEPQQFPLTVGTILGLTEPMVRQVVQRRDDNYGNIVFVGTYNGNVDGFQVRSFVRAGMKGVGQDWTPLIGTSMLGGNFLGFIRQSAGGFYDLQIRPVYRGVVGQPMNVYAVGVGEVFITAGQSNSTNWGASTGVTPDVRVSSFNPGSNFGLDNTFSGASWQWGIDPQPAMDASSGGSVWPTMASNLAALYNVPVGLYAVGYGSTSIADWLPPLSGSSSGQGLLFGRIINAINYFKLRGGVRAVLWDQGETDVALNTDPGVYKADLAWIISQSRTLTGVPIKWMVARATGISNVKPELQMGLEQAQVNVTDGIMTFQGPNTDSLGLAYRLIQANGLTVHFNAKGLVLLGGYWSIYIANLPGFIAPGALPTH